MSGLGIVWMVAILIGAVALALVVVGALFPRAPEAPATDRESPETPRESGRGGTL